MGTLSQDRISIQRRPWRRTWIVLTLPSTWRGTVTFTCPIPCRYTRRVSGSQRQPSPSLGPFHAVEPVRWLEPRVAGCLAGLDPPEEPGERPVQPAQRRLLGREGPHRHIRPDLPDLFELRRLVPVRHTGSPQPPGVPSFLQRGVVQLSMGRHASLQGGMLASGGPQPKPVGPSHAASHPLHGGAISARASTHTRGNPSGMTPPADQQKRASAMTQGVYPSGVTRTATLRPMARAPISLTTQAAQCLGAM